MKNKDNTKRVAVYLRVGTYQQLDKDDKKNINIRLSKEGDK